MSSVPGLLCSDEQSTLVGMILLSPLKTEVSLRSPLHIVERTCVAFP